MTGNEPAPAASGPEPLPLHAVIAAYDVSTRRPQRDIAQLFRDVAASAGAEVQVLRADLSHKEVTLAVADERNASLRHRLATLRRIQLLAASLSLLGAVLIGFGVNYLTSGTDNPGWVMLALGAMMQLGSLAASLVDREE